MPDLLQQAIRILLHGLLTELPAQLLTTAVAAAAATALRSRRRRQAEALKKPADPQP
ncbi:hypothetical protein ACIRU8_43045 [Streptomyces sp. NPDC101175]|uniref:hypothetical protein n=1 Tax=Streptomyces sp. NPDC101175 TaxID=3366123 RepID=UPI003835449F